MFFAGSAALQSRSFFGLPHPMSGSGEPIRSLQAFQKLHTNLTLRSAAKRSVSKGGNAHDASGLQSKAVRLARFDNILIVS